METTSGGGKGSTQPVREQTLCRPNNVQKTMLHEEVKCKRTDRVDEHPAKNRKRVHQTAADAVVGLLVGAM